MEQNKRRIQQTWYYLRRYKVKFILSLVFSVIHIFLSTIEPYILGLIITEITSNVLAMARGVAGAQINYRFVAMVLVIYGLRGLLNQTFIYLSNHLMTDAVQGAMADLRNDLLKKINTLPIEFFDTRQFGDVLGRFTNDVESLNIALQQAVLQITNAVLTVLFVTIMMFVLDYQLSIVVLLSLPLSLWLAQIMAKISQPHYKDLADALGDMNGYVQESLTGFNVVKLFNREERSFDEFEEIIHQLDESGFKASFISSLMMPVVGVVSHIAYLIVGLWGGFKVINGHLAIGNLQAFSNYVWQINGPVNGLAELSSIVQSAIAAIDRIWEVFDAESEPITTKQKLTEPLTGAVTFENVNFSYTPDNPLIRDFNVDVKPGETIAIVGPTGAGKTTMINLLMRFYDVNEGAIKVDGVDIRNFDRGEYRQQFGMVLQDAWLYEGTIEENLRFGRLDATDEEVVEAAKAANVDHFIRTLAGGYNMKMNAETSNVSLGQKQLLTIARALLSDPKILILDEATSSVDTRLELLIQRAMDTLMEGRTSFVIAHRLSTIQDADRILVMDQGQIIEQGNHESLLAQKGFYYDLYNSQFND